MARCSVCRPPRNNSDLAASTLLRWLNDGFIGGEQVTPGVTWRIRVTKELRGLIVPEVPPG